MSAKPIILHLIGSDFVGSPERLILGQIGNIPDFEFVCASFAKHGKNNELLSQAGSMGYKVEPIEDNYLFDLKIPSRIRAILERLNIVLMISHGYKADTYGYLAKRGATVPQAAYFHGWTREDLKMRFYNSIDRIVLPRLDSVIAVSKASANALAGHGVREEKIHVVYNALEIDSDLPEPVITPKPRRPSGS